jgi:hypothetical protein
LVEVAVVVVILDMLADLVEAVLAVLVMDKTVMAAVQVTQ